MNREACDALIKSRVPLQLVNRHNACPKGCYSFDTKKDALLTACPNCKTPKTEAKPWRVLRIADKFAELLACDDIREKLEYRYNNYPNEEVLKNRNNPNKVYQDVFDGDVYADLVEKGFMENKHDICIKIDIDGFKSKFSSMKMIIVHCVVLNYDIVEVSLKKLNKNSEGTNFFLNLFSGLIIHVLSL